MDFICMKTACWGSSGSFFSTWTGALPGWHPSAEAQSHMPSFLYSALTNTSAPMAWRPCWDISSLWLLSCLSDFCNASLLPQPMVQSHQVYFSHCLHIIRWFSLCSPSDVSPLLGLTVLFSFLHSVTLTFPHYVVFFWNTLYFFHFHSFSRGTNCVQCSI